MGAPLTRLGGAACSGLHLPRGRGSHLKFARTLHGARGPVTEAHSGSSLHCLSCSCCFSSTRVQCKQRVTLHSSPTPTFASLLFFSKVSYLLEGGSMAHEDFCGHAGQLNPGDLQVWPRRVMADGFLGCGCACLIPPTSGTFTCPPTPALSVPSLTSPVLWLLPLHLQTCSGVLRFSFP